MLNAGTSIKVASCALSDLYKDQLSDFGIQGKVTIPEYQRPYKWGYIEVSKLVSEIIDHFGSTVPGLPDYYLGSIILHQKDGKLNVIDGQQRLTTMGILFNLLGETVSITYMSPVSIQNIQKNIIVIREKIEELHTIKESVFLNINVTLVVTSCEDDAYNFFETQNTGGVRLRGVDIIKAFHLRAIASEKERGRYAIAWERQKAVDEVVKLLIKTRRWNMLDWNIIPGRMDDVGIKKIVIEEFSEKTKEDEKLNRAFQFVEMVNTGNGMSISMPNHHYHIRQPLSAGENFIDYFRSFCKLHESIFLEENAKQIDDELLTFFKALIFVEDGTTFLKWLFQMSLLCYTHRFGENDIIEAAYWIFRVTYSMRVSHQKSVREISLQTFVKDSRIIELLLSAFTHEQLIDKLRQFHYTVDENYTSGNSAKARFIARVANYFGFENSHVLFDENLKMAIKRKLQYGKV